MRAPAWTREEVILALDLYLKSGRKVLGAQRPEVIELSRVLNRLRIHPNEQRPDQFRSPNSVELKLANLRSLDPLTDSVGMQRGSTVDREVWDDFAADVAELEIEVRRIRASY